jgi:hypothetical protein
VTEDVMRMERRQLRERREGMLCRALGMPDESVVEQDRLGEEDRMRAGQGIVGVPITWRRWWRRMFLSRTGGEGGTR